jgi:hypothetical protein
MDMCFPSEKNGSLISEMMKIEGKVGMPKIAIDLCNQDEIIIS